MSFVRIKSGAYRTTDVSGRVFQLVEQYKAGAKGGYVTVKNGGQFPGFPEDIRVKVNAMSDYEFVGADEFEGQVIAVWMRMLQAVVNDSKSRRRAYGGDCRAFRDPYRNDQGCYSRRHSCNDCVGSSGCGQELWC
jgi:hypothetical protein